MHCTPQTTTTTLFECTRPRYFAQSRSSRPPRQLGNQLIYYMMASYHYTFLLLLSMIILFIMIFYAFYFRVHFQIFPSYSLKQRWGAYVVAQNNVSIPPLLSSSSSSILSSNILFCLPLLLSTSGWLYLVIWVYERKKCVRRKREKVGV